MTCRSFALDLGDDRGKVDFRLPNGEDQEALAWCAEEPVSIERLLARCILRMPSHLTLEDVRPLLEDRMEQLAPQMDLELEVVCPECGHAFSSTIDLPAFVLSEMAADPHSLRREVHFLAWHYHWPESEILTMSRKKRRRYVELLGDELERMNRS